MFTVKRLLTPGYEAAAHARDIRDIMRQELSLIGSTGEDPEGDYDIIITGPVTFQASKNIPKEAIDGAVQRIFDRVMKQNSAAVLAAPDK